MPPKRRKVPKYRHYKPKNLAVVRINGQDRYLGKYEGMAHGLLKLTADSGESDGSPDREAVCLRDAKPGKIIRKLGHHDCFVTVLACASDGHQVASADKGGTIRRWSLRATKPIGTDENPDGEVHQLVFLPDNAGQRCGWRPYCIAVSMVRHGVLTKQRSQPPLRSRGI